MQCQKIYVKGTPPQTTDETCLEEQLALRNPELTTEVVWLTEIYAQNIKNREKTTN